VRGLARAAVSASCWRDSIFYDVSAETVEVFGDYPKTEAAKWLKQFEKPELKEVPLSEIKDDLSRVSARGGKAGDCHTRHGKPAVF
jgi:hypothetical protein